MILYCLHSHLHVNESIYSTQYHEQSVNSTRNPYVFTDNSVLPYTFLTTIFASSQLSLCCQYCHYYQFCLFAKNLNGGDWRQFMLSIQILLPDYINLFGGFLETMHVSYLFHIRLQRPGKS